MNQEERSFKMKSSKHNSNGSLISLGRIRRMEPALRTLRLIVLALALAGCLGASTVLAKILGYPNALPNSEFPIAVLPVKVPVAMNPQSPPTPLAGAGDSVIYEFTISGPSSDVLEF